MKVKEVIEQLSKYPQDKAVVVLDSWGDDSRYDILEIYDNDVDNCIVIAGDF